MGEVYFSLDLTTNTYCAIKENRILVENAKRQFKQEAEILARLNHPNLPKVFSFFQISNQGQYIVMEYIDGLNLQEIIEQNNSPITEKQVIIWFTQIFDALSYLHSQSPAIIHRDIKPANIKINSNGKAFLVDFGIAKTYASGLLTMTGARAFTPGYSPPEQYGHSKTDVQSDIYSLGATIYKLLTAVTPPDSLQILTGSTPPPQSVHEINPNVSKQTSDAISIAMNIHRELRFPKVVSFKNALNQDLLKTDPIISNTLPTTINIQPRDTKLIRILPLNQKDISSFVKIFLSITIILIIFLGIFSLRDILVPELISPTAIANITESSTPTPKSLILPGFTATFTITYTFTPTSSPTIISTPTPGIGSTLISPVDNMLMAFIPAGTFLMGASSTDFVAWYSEKPQRSIFLDSYWIDKTEVTNIMYHQCVLSGSCSRPIYSRSFTRSNYFENPEFDNYPVIFVEWEQAQQYCTWAGRRLPTEAEWEKAARGPDGWIYPWGNNRETCQLANYWEYNREEKGNYIFDENIGCAKDTIKVGSMPEGMSFYGVQDLAGNVSEWVSDWYEEKYFSKMPSKNPEGPPDGTRRVIRGAFGWIELIFSEPNNRTEGQNVPKPSSGGYFMSVRGAGVTTGLGKDVTSMVFHFDLRSTFRSAAPMNYIDYNLGFRCATSR